MVNAIINEEYLNNLIQILRIYKNNIHDTTMNLYKNMQFTDNIDNSDFVDMLYPQFCL